MLEWWLSVGPPCACCGAALDVTFHDDERDARAAVARRHGFRVIEGRALTLFLTDNNRRRRRHQEEMSTVPSTR